MSSGGRQRLRVVFSLIATLGILAFVPDSRLVLGLLPILWLVSLYPLRSHELVAWGIAAVFFLFQNYMSLRAGLFEFRERDILLMPYYEPMLWGFYFVSIRRFASGSDERDIAIRWSSVSALAVTSAVFALFSHDPRLLLAATLVSTAFLFALFHTPRDLAYASVALILGFIIELFGVSTGLWSYPASDFLGIPYWFATMWISVGLLGRRFLIPAAEWLTARFSGQPA